MGCEPIKFTQVKLTMVKSQREKHLGKATGDMLKAIAALQSSGGDAAQSEIAERTATSRAFVTKMLKAMRADGLVIYEAYRGVQLSAEGERLATELARHHRLLERFLTDTLGFSPSAAHDEAERLEHVISEEFEERLAAFLNHPTTCPHGSPIPNADGTWPK
jgi:DtxR family transcriptional regulator, Mn-dependent transcriptional regulator